jgi:hypothetical protein
MRRVEASPLDAEIVYLFLKTNADFIDTEVYLPRMIEQGRWATGKEVFPTSPIARRREMEHESQ